MDSTDCPDCKMDSTPTDFPSLDYIRRKWTASTREVSRPGPTQIDTARTANRSAAPRPYTTQSPDALRTLPAERASNHATYKNANTQKLPTWFGLPRKERDRAHPDWLLHTASSAQVSYGVTSDPALTKSVTGPGWLAVCSTTGTTPSMAAA